MIPEMRVQRHIALFLVFLLLELMYGHGARAQSTESLRAFDRILHKGVDSLRTPEELQEGLTIARRIIKEYDQNPEYRSLVAQAFLISAQILQRESGDKAIGELNRGLLLQPDNRDLNREKGLVLMNLEKYRDAISFLEKAIRLDVNRIDFLARRSLVEAIEKIGNLEEKLRVYQVYVSFDSTNADILAKLGETYKTIGREKDAERLFDQALRHNPKQLVARLGKAKSKEERKDWVGAQENYAIVAQEDSGNIFVKKRLDTLKVYVHQEEKVKHVLHRAGIALQSDDHRKWEMARKELFELFPKNQESKLLLSKLSEKIYNYWDSEGYRNLTTDSLANALDCFKTSLDYVHPQKRDQAIEKYRQTAIRLARQIEARRAQHEATTARDVGKLRKALGKLTEAVILDSSLAKEIRPVIADLDRRVRIDSLESRYQLAKNEGDWYAARVFLLDILKLDPDNEVYLANLRIVETEIHWRLIKVVLNIASWSIGWGTVIFLLIRFRKKVAHFSRWLFQRKLITLMTLLLLSSLLFIVLFWTTLRESVPMIVEWANRNEGLVSLVTVAVNALWGIFVYKRYQKTKENSSTDQRGDGLKGSEKTTDGKVKYRTRVTGAKGKI